MNHLKIIVNYQTMPEERSWGEAPIVLPPRRLEVKIEFTLSTSWNNLPPMRVRRLTLTMEARDVHNDEDRLRDELLQNSRADYEWWATGAMVHDPNDLDWEIEIIDPSGVMKWFGIDRAKDIFKQHTQKHDELIRLSAPPVK